LRTFGKPYRELRTGADEHHRDQQRQREPDLAIAFHDSTMIELDLHDAAVVELEAHRVDLLAAAHGDCACLAAPVLARLEHDLEAVGVARLVDVVVAAEHVAIHGDHGVHEAGDRAPGHDFHAAEIAVGPSLPFP